MDVFLAFSGMGVMMAGMGVLVWLINKSYKL